MTLEKTLGLVRHFLTFVGGYFVTTGLLTEITLNTGIGAVATIIGIVWSVVDKNKNKKV